jgi:hypothetical protein
MKLRIRDKNNIHVITTLNEQASFRELKEEISKLTGVLPPYQECMLKKINIYLFFLTIYFFFLYKKKVKLGYPPRVCKAKDEDTLESAGFQNGDSIILTEISSAEIVNTQQGTPTVSAPTPAPAHALHTSTVSSTASESSPKDVISIPTENGFVILRV